MSNPRQTTPASTYPAKHTSTRTLVLTSLTARGMPVFARSVFVCPCLTADYSHAKRMEVGADSIGTLLFKESVF